MTFSLASLRIISSVTVTAKVPAGIATLILAFVVPILAKTVALVWIGEYERSQRAGFFVAKLENIVNAHLGCEKLLTWENELRDENKLRTTVSNKLRIPYEATIKLFAIIRWTSEGLSLCYCYLTLLDLKAMVPSDFPDIFPEPGDVKVAAAIGTVMFGLVLLYVEIRMLQGVWKAWISSKRYTTGPLSA